MTNFLLSSAICFDSAMTGFKAERKEKTTLVTDGKVRYSKTVRKASRSTLKQLLFKKWMPPEN